MRRLLQRRTTACLVVSGVTGLVLLAAARQPVEAQDRVTVQLENTSRPVVLIGHILDYTGTNLTIQAGTAGPQVLGADAVLRVETYYDPDHVLALESFQSGETEQARTLFQKALASESRDWVKREILAGLVRCDTREEDLISAAKYFLEITRSDPLTRHWGIAPLVWSPTAIGTSLSHQARVWLTGDDESAKLLGASWLLVDPVYGEAVRRELEKLGRSTNARITALSRMQLWRLKLASGRITDVTLSGWQDDINRLPMNMRAGPQYLKAAALVRLGSIRQASAELLWLPLVYSENEPLAARALREAADGLQQAGLTREAVTLYRELISRYAWSSESREAIRQLEAIQAAAVSQGGR